MHKQQQERVPGPHHGPVPCNRLLLLLLQLHQAIVRKTGHYGFSAETTSLSCGRQKRRTELLLIQVSTHSDIHSYY